MKNFKFFMPVMAFVMAAGMAVANKANNQAAGWIDKDGNPEQLDSEICVSGTNDPCKVRFTEDLNKEYQVFTDSDLQTPKLGGNGSYYILSE